MQESVLALYAVYFETLRFLDGQFRKLVEEEHRPNLPPAAVRPLTLSDALDALSQPPDPRFRTHASLALAWVYWARTRHQELPPTDEIDRNHQAIVEFLKKLHVDLTELERAPSGEEAFLVPLARACKLRRFWIRQRFHVGTDVTSCVSGVEAARTVGEFKELADPRIWERTAHALFAKTHRTIAIPSDPDTDPANADAGGWNPPLGEPWAGLLFEEAHWPIGMLETTARNVLRIDYQKLSRAAGQGGGGSGSGVPKGTGAPADPNNRLFMRYWLYESLTHRIEPFGSSQYGGIDCDSGFFDVRDAEAGFVSICAKKSLRFTGELAPLNVLMPAALFLWMTFATMAVGCYQFSPEKVV
jgi:hypothetical protein